MNKKRSIVLAACALAVCITMTIAIAANMADKADEPLQTESQPLYETYQSEPVYNKTLSDTQDNSIFAMLDRSGKSKAAIYDDMFSYLWFKEFYSPSPENLSYINGLISQGADIHRLTDIYSFWLTTSDNISMVGQIYGLSDRFSGDHWIEEAFNYLTQNAHGVLDAEGVSAYLSERVTPEDIKIANILCRKGILTIQQILDRYAAGEEWPALIAYIQSSGTAAQASQRSTVAGPQVETAQELLAWIQYQTIISGQNAPVAALTAENTPTPSEALGERAEQTTQEVYARLLADGIFVRDDSERNQKANGQLREKIRQNGVTEEQIESLLDQGYRLVDILNASEAAEAPAANTSVESILQAERAELLTREGGLAQ